MDDEATAADAAGRRIRMSSGPKNHVRLHDPRAFATTSTHALRDLNDILASVRSSELASYQEIIYG